MTKKEHQKRHQLLYFALDELVADWIFHQGKNGKNFFTTKISLKEFVDWSYEQGKNPSVFINSEKINVSDLYHKPWKWSKKRPRTLKVFPCGDEFSNFKK